MEEMYKQCAFKSGERETDGWILEKFAKIGKWVTFDDSEDSIE